MKPGQWQNPQERVGDSLQSASAYLRARAKRLERYSDELDADGKSIAHAIAVDLAAADAIEELVYGERFTAPTGLMSCGEVATHLGIDPESVRSTMRRYGIPEVRGYPADQVLALQRKPRGRTPKPKETT